MKENIETKLNEAKASAVMIVESSYGMSDLDGYGEAITAIAMAQSRPSPQADYKAEQACVAFLVANAEAAIAAIDARIERRQANAAAPLGESAQRAIRGQD